jgi:hypothetical protein
LFEKQRFKRLNPARPFGCSSQENKMIRQGEAPPVGFQPGKSVGFQPGK